MKLFKKIILTVTLLCLIILIESCATTTLVDEWADPSYNGGPLKKFLIIAIRKDPVQRRIWEDAFVAELAKQGVKALPSYHLFPDILPDTNQLAQTVLENGFDGILITRLLDAATTSHYIQGYVTSEAQSHYNEFRKRYDTYYQNVLHPGYVESTVIDRRAIDVWTTANEDKMIWSATSNTPERNTVEAVQNDIAELVIPELLKIGIIHLNK